MYSGVFGSISDLCPLHASRTSLPCSIMTIKKCLRELPNIPCGAKLPLTKNHWYNVWHFGVILLMFDEQVIDLYSNFKKLNSRG